MKLGLFTASVLSGMLTLAYPSVGNAQAISPTTNLTTATINDPSLGERKAFTVTLPSGWQFQGTVIASLRCSLPSPVFRAYSPDGLTEMRLLPAFNWEVQSSKSGQEGLGKLSGCIYLHETLTAAQFLDRYVKTLGGANVVGPMSVSPARRQQLDNQLSQMNANFPKNSQTGMVATGDDAALRIETVNGTFTIEQRVQARVICTLWPKPIAGIAGNCFARVDALRAPKGQLDALVALVDTHSLTNAQHDDSWLSAVLAGMEYHGETILFDPPRPNQIALATMHRQAEDFGLIDEIEELKRKRMDYTEAVDRPRPDWADFAIEHRPTVTGDGHVQFVIECKWSNSSGQWYQTRYPNADPNGTLPGKWAADMLGGTAGNRIDDMKARGMPRPQ